MFTTCASLANARQCLETAYDYLDSLYAGLSHNAYCRYPERQTCVAQSHGTTAAQYETLITRAKAHVEHYAAEYRRFGGKYD